MGKRINYRKIAFAAYDPLCAHCGFGVAAVLEVAHVDGNRQNNDPQNLVILCPNCHKMHDLDLISTETIIQMRDRPKIVKWSKRMKDAGKKAALTRKQRDVARMAETRCSRTEGRRDPEKEPESQPAVPAYRREARLRLNGAVRTRGEE